MSEIITRTARIKPAPTGRNASGCATLWCYEPGPGDQVDLGSLYLVVEVMAATSEAEDVADLIVQTADHHYYDLAESDSKPEKQFELTIKAVNQALAQYASAGNASWVGRISAVIGLLADGQLHLSSSGSAEAWLWRGEHSHHLTEDKSTGPSQPGKTFGEIISGPVKGGDRLLFTTPVLLHHLSQEEMSNAVRDYSPNRAIAKLTADLDKQNYSHRIATLVVQLTSADGLSDLENETDPDEITLQAPASLLGSAKEAAEPFVESATKTSKSVIKKSGSTLKEQIIPGAKSGAQKVGGLTSKLVRLGIKQVKKLKR